MAHRQEITCARFLDPLPCLATADMTGKVLIWATRPHPRGGALLLVIRNTVISARDVAPSVAHGGVYGQRRARDQRKVLPTPVTCIGFHHHVPSGSDPTEASKELAARRAGQAGGEAHTPKEAAEVVSDRQDEEKSTNAAARPVWEAGSILFTGDELGAIKVWDLTGVLLDRLGPAACSAKAVEDAATIPPASFGAASHHFVHYRQGPLDGVGLQAAVRFRELIDIARALRRGEHLQAVQPGSDSDNRLHRADLDGGESSALGREKKADRRPSEAKSSTESVSDINPAAASADRPRDGSSAGRRRKERGLGQKSEGQVDGSSNHLSSGGSEPDAFDGRHSVRRPVGAREQTEAALNASPDDINPVASWTGHGDSVTSMEIILDPPSIVTGSLDSSVRLFSLDGRLLGEMAEKKDASRAAVPWCFQPPPKGRDSEARARAAALEQTLKSVRHEERQPASSGIAGSSTLPADQRLQAQSSPSSTPGKAPANGSDAFDRHCGANPVPGMDRPSPSTGDPASAALAGKGEEAAAGERGSSRARSAVSVVCLSRINELTRVRVAEVSTSSDGGSDRLQTAADSIEERLLSEAREGRECERGAGARQSPASADGYRQGRDKRHGQHQAVDPPNGAPPPPLPQKLPPNLSSERERKQAKRTRSTLQFLVNSINRTSGLAGSKPALSRSKPSRLQTPETVRGPQVTGRAQGDWCSVSSRPFTSPGAQAKGSRQKDGSTARRESEATLAESTARLSPASKLRHAVVMVAPYLAMQIEAANKEFSPSPREGADAKAGKEKEAGDGGREGEDAGEKGGTTLLPRGSVAPLTQRSTANVLLTQRSAVALASARSNRSIKSCLSQTRPAVSAKVAVGRRMAADRRRRRMENILDGVRRIGVVSPSPSDPRADAQEQASDTEAEAAVGDRSAVGAAAAATGERGGGTIVISTRVREVLSRFERSENGGEDSDEDDELDHQTMHRVKSMRRQLDARTAARQEAIRHNERYRRAQRYDLITLQKTQLRRQEAMVGLTGPSGERFGPYTLDDVLEFRVFLNQLNSQGGEHLTVRALIENPDIQADPYSDALLQELTKSGVLRWNQPISLEDLMQVRCYGSAFRVAKQTALAVRRL